MKPAKYVLRHAEKARERRIRKQRALTAVQGLSHNEVAEMVRIKGQTFTNSQEWKEIRGRVLDKYGRKCMKCGFVPGRGQCINVDHIKPRAYYPELALEFNNLQVLCPACNREKGNKHATDYRPKEG